MEENAPLETAVNNKKIQNSMLIILKRFKIARFTIKNYLMKTISNSWCLE
ncbi:hypothetical protein [Staphylococcus aureus]